MAEFVRAMSGGGGMGFTKSRVLVPLCALAVALSGASLTFDRVAAAPSTHVDVASSSLLEGDVGLRTAVVEITLSAPATKVVSVSYRTGDRTAVAAAPDSPNRGDYRARSGKVSFKPGEVAHTVRVSIIPNRVQGPSKTFLVRLGAAVGATIGLGVGTVTILDDDTTSGFRIGIGDVSLADGDTQARRALVPVTFSNPAPFAFKLMVATGEGTALAGSDYVSLAHTSDVRAGMTEVVVAITVKPNPTPGLNKTVVLSLKSTFGSTVRARGVLTLLNDDLSSSAPPPPGGYFRLRGVGSWSSLPGDAPCATQVRRSTWEPRADNAKRNHVVPNANAVHQSLAARPVDTASYNARWNSWLLPRVDGQFSGTTDEIFQWAACKWGLPDNLLRGIAVRESTWYQYETYSSGRCVLHFSCGDFFSAASSSSSKFCAAETRFGYDYQTDFGAGLCPKTFGIVGVMSWQDPSWGVMADNQNGTFPFNRDSTAFAVDYLGASLRGCFEGWQKWLAGPGDLWGCVGAWFSGQWHSTAADGYIGRVQNEIGNLTWLQAGWPTNKPGCSTIFGCPRPDQLSV
jgi:hypothetical protein